MVTSVAAAATAAATAVKEAVHDAIPEVHVDKATPGKIAESVVDTAKDTKEHVVDAGASVAGLTLLQKCFIFGLMVSAIVLVARYRSKTRVQHEKSLA